MLAAFVVLVFLAGAAFPQAPKNLLTRERSAPAVSTRGAAFSGRTLYTWGDELTAWSIPDLRPHSIVKSRFGEGGCLTDLDADGREEFVGVEGEGLGRLLWRRPPSWKPELVDTAVEMHDCLEAKLFGRRGLLMVNRHMQVRFYQRPAESGSPWPYREIYSFYTGSQQSGLVLEDIDGDGATDILCGNYWIRNPRREELPWRLFAINTHHKTPTAAMVRFARLGPGWLWIQQSHEVAARAMEFRSPPDPKQLWAETLYAEDLKLVQPHGLAKVPGLEGGRTQLLVGEHNGDKSRIFLFKKQGGRLQPTKAAEGVDVLEIFPLSGLRFVTAGASSVDLWSYRPRR